MVEAKLCHIEWAETKVPQRKIGLDSENRVL